VENLLTITKVPKAAPAEENRGNRFKIASERISLGMFVAELDRPWLDTPFLIQGFQVDRDDEIKALRKYSRYVYIDLNLSHPELADVIRSAELLADDAPEVRDFRGFRESGLKYSTEESAKAQFQADLEAGPDTVYKKPGLKKTRLERVGPPDDPTPMRARDGTERRQKDRVVRDLLRVDFRPSDATGSLSGVRSWLQGLFSSRPSKGAIEKAKRENRAELKKILPKDIVFKRYQEPKPIAVVLPKAEKAFERTRKALETLSRDLRNDRIPQIAQIKDAVEDMVGTMVQNPDALMWVARLKEDDAQVYDHGVKVAIYLIALGRHLGFPKDEMAYLGTIGLLADVGKTKVARSVLEKPGMLDPAEFTEVKRHVEIGIKLLKGSMKLPEPVIEGISQHHERLDGSGYPLGLSGEQIGIYGRMAAIADSFAALVSTRPYANASSAQDALMNLYEWCGTSFHEPLVEQFVQAIGIFPVGSMVELSSGEIAIVLSHNRTKRLEPKVLIISWPDHRPLSTPLERDLNAKPLGGDGSALRISRGLASGAYGLQVKNYYGNELANANGLV
jgi:HD-GYP domain-containing protein (c-di-GMP phosphodiesterase class II)